MSNFQNLIVVAVFTDENNPITFSYPTLEASLVPTIGKHSKGEEVQTTLAWSAWTTTGKDNSLARHGRVVGGQANTRVLWGEGEIGHQDICLLADITQFC